MLLIQEIIDLLSSKSPSLENSLFKAKVLAHKLGETDLSQWVNSELTGYAGVDLLPSYRIVSVTIMANISNGAYRYQDHPIPLAHIDKNLRERLQTTHLTQSVAVIEKWAKNESDLSVVIAPEMYPKLSKGLGNGFSIERAWGKHSVGAMLQVIVEVRSRLLDFVLALSDKIPSEPDQNEIRKVSKEIGVKDIFRNAVFGNNTTIVVGDGTIQGVSNTVISHNFESLAVELRRHSVQDADIALLKEAIAGDEGAEQHKDKNFGPHVKKWIADMLAKAGSSAWSIAVRTGGAVLTAALLAYYGFGA
jgi:hypothetical protein